MNRYNTEQWAMDVEKLPRHRKLNTDELHLYAKILCREDCIDQDIDLRNDLEKNKLGYASVIWNRVNYLHSYKISPSLAIFLGYFLITNLGISTMLANYLQYQAFKFKIKYITLSIFNTMIFPDGYISEEDWSKAWEWQKIKPEGYWDSDNMLDDPKYMESIREE